MNPSLLLDGMIADPYMATTFARQAMRLPSMATREQEPTPYELYLQQQQMQQAQQQGQLVPQEPVEEGGGGFLGMLGYVGDSLDKLGSRPLRGLLKGRPRELLSVLPFSDALGITDPKDIVSGGDLLGTKRRRGLGYRAAELGVEMLLDPLALLGPGILGRALTKSGKAAKAAGLLEKLPEAGKALGMGPEVAKGTLSPQQLIDASATAVAQNAPMADRVQRAKQLSKFREAVAKAEGVSVDSLKPETLQRYLDGTLGGVMSLDPVFPLSLATGGQRVFGTQADLAAKGGLPILNKVINKPLKAAAGSRAFPFLESAPITRALNATGASQYAIPRLAGKAVDAAVGLGSKATRNTLNFAEGVFANPAVALDSLRQVMPGTAPSAAVQAARPILRDFSGTPSMPRSETQISAFKPPPTGASADEYGSLMEQAVINDGQKQAALHKYIWDQAREIREKRIQDRAEPPVSLSDAEKDLAGWENMAMPSPQDLEALASQAMRGGRVPSMKSLADAEKAAQLALSKLPFVGPKEITNRFRLINSLPVVPRPPASRFSDPATSVRVQAGSSMIDDLLRNLGWSQGQRLVSDAALGSQITPDGAFHFKEVIDDIAGRGLLGKAPAMRTATPWPVQPGIKKPDVKSAALRVEPVGTEQATRKTYKPRDPQRPLSVRFNLSGKYKGMWVVEDESTGQRFFYDPEKTSLKMESPLLHNESRSATKIYDAQKKVDENTAAGIESPKKLLEAAQKQAVARVLASKVEALPIESIGDEVSSLLGVTYNPKKAPYWRSAADEKNIDMLSGDMAVTRGRQVFGSFGAPSPPAGKADAAKKYVEITPESIAHAPLQSVEEWAADRGLPFTSMDLDEESQYFPSTRVQHHYYNFLKSSQPVKPADFPAGSTTPKPMWPKDPKIKTPAQVRDYYARLATEYVHYFLSLHASIQHFADEARFFLEATKRGNTGHAYRAGSSIKMADQIADKVYGQARAYAERVPPPRPGSPPAVAATPSPPSPPVNPAPVKPAAAGKANPFLDSVRSLYETKDRDVIAAGREIADKAIKEHGSNAAKVIDDLVNRLSLEYEKSQSVPGVAASDVERQFGIALEAEKAFYAMRRLSKWRSSAGTSLDMLVQDFLPNSPLRVSQGISDDLGDIENALRQNTESLTLEAMRQGFAPYELEQAENGLIHHAIAQGLISDETPLLKPSERILQKSVDFIQNAPSKKPKASKPRKKKS